MTDEAVAEIRHRFAKALEKQSHAQHNVDAGREFVEAYVAMMVNAWHQFSHVEPQLTAEFGCPGQRSQIERG